MNKLKTLSVLAFMAFTFSSNATAQIQNDSEINTTQETSDVQTSGKKFTITPSDDWSTKKYFNINLVTSQTRTLDGADNQRDEMDVTKGKKDWGVGITAGRTFYVHKKPILNMIKIGIDWSYLDLTYVKYKKANIEDPDLAYIPQQRYFGDQQAEYAMAVGPSVTVNPIDKLKVNAYLRYMPACSVIFDDKKADVQFASGGQFGMSVSYKLIALGFETRWMSSKYNLLHGEDEIDDSTKDDKFKFNTKSFRFFIGFRF